MDESSDQANDIITDIEITPTVKDLIHETDPYVTYWRYLCKLKNLNEYVKAPIETDFHFK